MESSRVRETTPLTLPFPWKQSEHLAVVGDTGTGKSTLIARLLTTRAYSIVLKSKADPVSFPGKLVRTARALDNAGLDRFVLQPKYREQRREIAAALERVWVQGGWCICVDELFYVSDKLKLAEPVEMLLTQGRSKGISVVNGMQRPVRVTRFALSQATHAITFRLDPRDALTFCDATNTALRPLVTTLGEYEFLWYYRPKRRAWIGKLDLKADDLAGGEVSLVPMQLPTPRTRTATI